MTFLFSTVNVQERMVVERRIKAIFKYFLQICIDNATFEGHVP